MNETLKHFSKYLLLIAIIGVALNLLFGESTVLNINKTYIGNGLIVYKYDFKNYIENLNNTIGNTVPLSLTLPPHEWLNSGQWDIVFSNNMKVIGDYIVLIINIIMYPLRVGAYVIKNLLAVLGVRQEISDTSGINWLVNLINGMYNSQLPYIE